MERRTVTETEGIGQGQQNNDSSNGTDRDRDIWTGREGQSLLQTERTGTG